jgi:hypothetical protein
MEPSPKDLIGITVVIWIVIATIIISASVLRHLRRRETEKTIRLAIEKGQALDNALVTKLLEPRIIETKPEQLLIGGIVVLFVGLGLALMGFFISLGQSDLDALFAMLGVGSLVGCVGLGLLVSSGILRKHKKNLTAQD